MPSRNLCRSLHMYCLLLRVLSCFNLLLNAETYLEQNPQNNPGCSIALTPETEGEGNYAFHLGEHGSTPGGVTPGFWHDAVGQRIFSGMSCFPPPLHSGYIQLPENAYGSLGRPRRMASVRPDARQLTPQDACNGVPRCSLVSGWNAFNFLWLHDGYWLLLRAPRIYRSEQAPTYLATLRHTPLPSRIRLSSKVEKKQQMSPLRCPHFGATSGRSEVSIEPRRNARVGKTRDPGGNSPTSGIVRPDYHMRKSPGATPQGNRTRGGGGGGSEYTTAAANGVWHGKGRRVARQLCCGGAMVYTPKLLGSANRGGLTLHTERGGAVVTHWARIRKDPGSISSPAILISAFRDFPKSLQANAGIACPRPVLIGSRPNKTASGPTRRAEENNLHVRSFYSPPPPPPFSSDRDRNVTCELPSRFFLRRAYRPWGRWERVVSDVGGGVIAAAGSSATPCLRGGRRLKHPQAGCGEPQEAGRHDRPITVRALLTFERSDEPAERRVAARVTSRRRRTPQVLADHGAKHNSYLKFGIHSEYRTADRHAMSGNVVAAQCQLAVDSGPLDVAKRRTAGGSSYTSGPPCKHARISCTH
ncbi:hypothetical protein PR048_028050 [Dryococelus australis]|uniref:Uncharacterized protein n=1 Tax=Dryococelus australis TaxID=614101 RepID=A0ABQ9GI82_9NEOP|nr:hypothetical protein PR048_028050 [Dryococelus australis]